MKKELMESLNQECKDIIDNLKEMDCSSDEYAEAIKNLGAIRKVMMDDAIHDHKIAMEDFESDLKAQEKKIRVFEMIGTIGIGVVNVLAALYKHKNGMDIYQKLFYDGLKFEEEGVIGSNMVRNHINQDKISNITK